MMVSKSGNCLPPKTIRPIAAAVLAALAGTSGHAAEIATGNEDLNIRADVAVRYSLGVRAEKVNPTFANSAATDETENRFQRGDVVTNRIDLLGDLDVVYRKRHGFRVSGAAWKDAAYDSTSTPTVPGGGNYVNDKFSGYANKYIRRGGEVLDAFVFTGFDIGEVGVNIKLGKHNVYWGESLFSFGDSIAYSQGPVDTIKASGNPGLEIKELFLPQNQLSAQVQFSPEWSMAAQYMLDWEPFRFAPGGTYFAAGDGIRSDLASTQADGFAIPNGPDVLPRKRGNYGVSLRWTPAWLNGAFGLYYRKFDERLPWGAAVLSPTGFPAPFNFAPSSVNLVFPRATQLVGASMTTNLGSVSVGSEVSYRKNTALRSGAMTMISPTGQADYAALEGARGNTFHALVNGLYALPKTPLWEQGTLLAELTYTRLLSVTKNPADLTGSTVFMGEGNAACTGPAKDPTCATKNALSATVNFAPQWNQVAPGLDLSMPLSVGYAIQGNGAALSSGNEGDLSWSLGLGGVWRGRYEFALKYIDRHARDSVQNNHGWVSLTFKTSL